MILGKSLVSASRKNGGKSALFKRWATKSSPFAVMARLIAFLQEWLGACVKISRFLITMQS